MELTTNDIIGIALDLDNSTNCIFLKMVLGNSGDPTSGGYCNTGAASTLVADKIL